MKTQNLIKIALMMLLFFVLLLFQLINIYPQPKQIESYKMRITVSDHLGIGSREEPLDFGLATPGSVVTKNIKLISKEKVRVKIYIEGSLAKWVTISDNNFILEPAKEKVISISAFIPKDAEYGDYYGEANILIFKQK